MQRIISLITFYNPTLKNCENANRIIGQSDYTIIIDNSDDSNEKLLDSFFFSDKVKYVPNYDNLGLSIAFNKVLKNQDIIEWRDSDLIIFFDQDSVIDNNHINILVKEYNLLKLQGINVGGLGPYYFDKSYGAIRVPKSCKRISNNSISVELMMTSSMICKYSDLQQVGFWNERVFLDMADWDLCWRMRKNGFQMIMTDVKMLIHAVGEGRKKVGPINLQIAKPFREYYQTRDSLYLIKENYVPLKYRIRILLQVTLRPLLHILFLDKKEERKYYIKLGFQHYIQKRTGRLLNADKWK